MNILSCNYILYLFIIRSIMNYIYKQYLTHVHFEGGKLWMSRAVFLELLTISGVTLTLSDYRQSVLRASQ